MAVTADSLKQKKGLSRLSVAIACSDKEVDECLELRYQVFATELGAKIRPHKGNLHQDRDSYDAWCRHIRVTDNQTGRLVATTRVLTSDDIRYTGNFYSETEFDISSLLIRDLRLMEIGRTCISAEYRRSTALALLWSSIARIASTENINYLMGCASIPVSAGDAYINNVINYLRQHHYSSEMFRVRPLVPLRLNETMQGEDVILPTLLRAYLRQGAVICGNPYWDASFNVADVFVLLDCEQITSRYRRHFMQRAR